MLCVDEPKRATVNIPFCTTDLLVTYTLNSWKYSIETDIMYIFVQESLNLRRIMTGN